MSRKRFAKRALSKLLEAFGSRCRMCQCEINGTSGLEWDHRIPLAIGGEDELDNLEPLCIRCHRLKTKGDVATIAKAVRVQQNHLGIGESRTPMPFGRKSAWKKKMNGEIVRREP